MSSFFLFVVFFFTRCIIIIISSVIAGVILLFNCSGPPQLMRFQFLFSLVMHYYCDFFIIFILISDFFAGLITPRKREDGEIDHNLVMTKFRYFEVVISDCRPGARTSQPPSRNKTIFAHYRALISILCQV